MSALCDMAYAEESSRDDMSETLAEEESVVSAEVSVSLDSRYLSYGFVDNKDPILVPDGSLTFADLFTVGSAFIYDTTRYGHKAGYSSREWKINEVDPYAELGSELLAEDYEWLPTSIEWDVGYMYEYHPRSKGKGADEDSSWCKDTQFICAGVTFMECPLNPHFYYERDIDRDNGTYVNLEFSHEFELIEDVLALTPSIAQGFGDKKRVGGYCCHSDEDETPLRHMGLMDTLLKLELSWSLTDDIALGGYVGYSDFIFDRKIRHAARDYEASGHIDDSYNFIWGLSVAFNF